jgi:sugar O-acyltransferase (sialic acid O-acetyltransferase NeuD family)
METTKKLVIYGIGETAEIIADYFQLDSEYSVVAFTADQQYKNIEELNGLPVVDFETVSDLYSPDNFEMFAAASFSNLNTIRQKMFRKGKEKGYRFASYVHSSAFVWHNVEIGENTFVFEGNVLQYKVKIGSNVILWSGNHVGHQSIIEDNCFISSHVVISGFCRIGRNSFIGVNSSLNDEIIFGKYGVTGNGSIIVKNTEEGSIYVGNPAKKIKSSYEVFRVTPE